MSDASEYARNLATAKAAKPAGIVLKDAGAHVTDDGRWYLSGGGCTIWLDAKDAVQIARWTLTTFGETQPKAEAAP